MDILFLDIDGVLNSEAFYIWRHENHLDKKVIGDIDENCVLRLKKIVDETHCKIVVSSSWRYSLFDKILPVSNSVKLALDMFKRNNIELFDRTGFDWHRNRFNLFHGRGLEIKKWVTKHPTVNRCVVLDDDLMDLNPYKDGGILVQTSDVVGLTDADAARAVQILKYGPTWAQFINNARKKR